APEEVRRLEGQLTEEPLELRDAGTERELVAVLLLELHPHVHLALGARQLLDGDVLGRALDRLEVAELVEAPDAVLERLAVEDAVLVEPHLAPDHVVARGRVADERDAVDEV